MTKELSIKSIKENIVDKLLNNMDVLNYLEAKEFMEGTHLKISELRNNLIFDHDSSHAYDNYIAVDVSENEYSPLANAGHDFTVIIKMGLRQESNIDKMSETIKDIITKIYPDRNRYSNIPIKVTTTCPSCGQYEKLRRIIRFSIKC
ncbi:hypothetical protein I6E50_07335 [Roseburia hominis]|uniref:hypothetical protein n=1 Tax=Roseburia hominis TaxID=301301 RepID=UPI001F475DE7|nr:hypothetical protein [Roseburia hominis]